MHRICACASIKYCLPNVLTGHKRLPCKASLPSCPAVWRRKDIPHLLRGKIPMQQVDIPACTEKCSQFPVVALPVFFVYHLYKGIFANKEDIGTIIHMKADKLLQISQEIRMARLMTFSSPPTCRTMSFASSSYFFIINPSKIWNW